LLGLMPAGANWCICRDPFLSTFRHGFRLRKLRARRAQAMQDSQGSVPCHFIL
jgi:hypothetical protein